MDFIVVVVNAGVYVSIVGRKVGTNQGQQRQKPRSYADERRHKGTMFKKEKQGRANSTGNRATRSSK